MARTHGLSGTTEYSIWSGMQARCHNPRNKKFKQYGGRGIVVCDEWRGPGGFLRFLAHIGERPSSRYSIDRIDGNDSYRPGNVRWATRETQLANRRPVPKHVYSANGARNALRSGGKVWSLQATDELCRAVREELEERFGPAPHIEPLISTSVEQAFIEHDYAAKNYHFEGLENICAKMPKNTAGYRWAAGSWHSLEAA